MTDTINTLRSPSLRWRVAVLDDDERSRAALDSAIVRAGGRMTAESTACNGALDLVQRSGADVVIVASSLPGGDAISVAAETTMAGCPVVLVGREATSAMVARALHAGVMGFLLKPLRRDQLAPTLDLAVARFRETQRLKRALEDRKAIERAKGRLMEREGLSEDQAFRMLRTTAMNTRRPMVEIALELLRADTGDEREPAGPPSRPAARVHRGHPGHERGPDGRRQRESGLGWRARSAAVSRAFERRALGTAR